MIILNFVGFKTALILTGMCKLFIDASSDNRFFPQIDPEDIPNRAIMGFIVDVGACHFLSHFRRSVRLLTPNQTVSENLYQFAHKLR